jgi:hypothetical protein
MDSDIKRLTNTHLTNTHLANIHLANTRPTTIRKKFCNFGTECKYISNPNPKTGMLCCFSHTIDEFKMAKADKNFKTNPCVKGLMCPYIEWCSFAHTVDEWTFNGFDDLTSARKDELFNLHKQNEIQKIKNLGVILNT